MSGATSIVRLLTLGDSGAGKSSLLLQYTQKTWSSDYMPTIGIDFRLKTITVQDRKVKVQVWDTAGQERFRTITHNYYRGAHGIVLVYDVTQRQSFENISKWIQDVHTYVENQVNIVLVGNKCDLLDKKVVETAEGQALADEYDIKFYETSAKTNTNVDDAFTYLVEKVCSRLFANSPVPKTAGGGGGSGVVVDGDGSGDGGSSRKCCNK